MSLYDDDDDDTDNNMYEIIRVTQKCFGSVDVKIFICGAAARNRNTDWCYYNQRFDNVGRTH